MEQINYVVLGLPGSGKGTQAALLAKETGLVHISTGDEFRKIREEDSDIGRRVRELIDAGNLGTDEVANAIFLRVIKNPEVEKGAVFDGYPRRVTQAEFFKEYREVTKCIFIDVSEEECAKRMGARRVCSECNANYNTIYIKPKEEGVCDKCGGELKVRDDSTPEAIQKRFEVYHKETEPTVDYYEEKGLLLRVNGEQPIDDVFEELKKGLE
ncbi:MAG: nucleoside monophosphate kinase [Nanoarchaeota archaeon]|nr:nucleoside monophosphate kinase [Nanoarchaeota archaeon]MBU1321281.1 nucleoside monophosphate kinase [Nanoarchaeota archaeon]MBU1597111.1 nucleoside monophosphate kinase [Nanoarchaeota archaeon]MBU2442146.1 nucleoside monophosphate kinase [Nanoarchaeota archaeon]